MNILKRATEISLIAATAFFALSSNAQVAGNSATTCTQQNSAMTCVTTTSFALSNTTLQGLSGSSFALSGASTTPSPPNGCSASPVSSTVAIGATPTLNVSCASGSTPFTYQWRKGGVNIASATSLAYTLSPNSDTASSGTTAYDVLISNSLGASISSAANVTVGNTPEFPPTGCAITPFSPTVAVGATQLLTVSCTAGTSLAYQWFKGNTPINGATSASYAVPSSDTATSGSQVYNANVRNSITVVNASANVIVANVTQPSGCTSSGSASGVIDAGAQSVQNIGTLYGTTTTYIVRLTVPQSASTSGGLLAQIAHAEAPSNQRAFRTVVLSKCAGDMTSTDAIVLSSNSIGASTEVSINDAGRGAVNITAGTWYVNVRNNACPANQACNVLIDWVHY